MPVAWFTLDHADRDPYVFLDYLLYTLRPYVPAADNILEQLGTTSPQALPAVYRATALAIADAPQPFALVLDDIHVLDDDGAPLPGTALVYELLAALVEYATNCHLVFSSRTLPALHGMARLVAQQRAAVFDYTALQVSAADVQRLAGITRGAMLPDDAAEQLTLQLSGWVTGIVLSLDYAVQVQGQPILDIAADATPLYNFFAEQIISPLPPELQSFLEETSVLDDLSPQRCDLLRGCSDSALFLDDIRRRGLFVSSRAGWLTYHSLFRDFLQLRLRRNPQRAQALFRRAGDLYRAEEDLERALDCYLTAQAEHDAVDLLRHAVPRFRRRSRQTTLLACFERLGQGRILPPDLLLAQARVYSDLALWERAHLALQLAETIGSAATIWEAALISADILIVQGDRTRAQQVLDSVPVEALPDELQLDYHLTSGRVQILQGAIAAAIRSLEHAQALAPKIADTQEDPSVLAYIYDNLGWAYATQGDHRMAMRYLKRADACWQACGNNGRRALTLNNLGIIVMEEGRYAEARALFEDGLTLARQTGSRREETVLCCSLADLDIMEGDLEQAIGRFTEAHVLAQSMDVASSTTAAAIGALWAAAMLGDVALAQQWSDSIATLFSPSEPGLRGRKALAQSLLMLQQPQPNAETLGDLAAEATAVEAYLSGPERAYVALLRAAMTFKRTGWPRAASEWELFEHRAASLPEGLLMRLVPIHRQLFDAAAKTSPLARHLREMVNQPAPTRWQITALGAFTCLVDGLPCDLSALHRALLVRLLDAGPQGLTVERLWESVWGDSDLSMTALHQALRRLRVQTGLAVSARDGFCTIRSPWSAIAYDVRAFERALDEAPNREAVQRAIALYKGDFLPGAPLSAALWVDARRDHLQQRYLATLEQLALTVERDAPHMAMHYYQQVLQIDGCREQTAMRLMQLAARFGNRSLVTTTFEHLKGALQMLGTSPEPATTALYQQLH